LNRHVNAIYDRLSLRPPTVITGDTYEGGMGVREIYQPTGFHVSGIGWRAYQ
jgi:hypothetical protein